MRCGIWRTCWQRASRRKRWNFSTGCCARAKRRRRLLGALAWMYRKLLEAQELPAGAPEWQAASRLKMRGECGGTGGAAIEKISEDAAHERSGRTVRSRQPLEIRRNKSARGDGIPGNAARFSAHPRSDDCHKIRLVAQPLSGCADFAIAVGRCSLRVRLTKSHSQEWLCYSACLTLSRQRPVHSPPRSTATCSDSPCSPRARPC